MAFDYDGMRDRIRNNLARGSLTSGRVKEEVLSAIEYYKSERFVFNTTLDSTACVGISLPSLDLPSQFSTTGSVIQIDTVILDWPSSRFRETLRERPLNWLQRQRSTASYVARPSYWGRYGDKVLFDSFTDATYTFELTFHGELIGHSDQMSGNFTNAWFNGQAEELIRTRSRISLLRNHIRNPESFQEAAALAAVEEDLFWQMKRAYSRQEAGGKVLPYGPGSHTRWSD